MLVTLSFNAVIYLLLMVVKVPKSYLNLSNSACVIESDDESAEAKALKLFYTFLFMLEFQGY